MTYDHNEGFNCNVCLFCLPKNNFSATNYVCDGRVHMGSYDCSLNTRMSV